MKKKLFATIAGVGLTGALVLAAFAATNQTNGSGEAGTAPGKSAPEATATKPAAVSNDPDVTTASFGDWVMQCQKAGGDLPSRVCEVMQSIIVEGQTGPVAQIAVGRAPKESSYRFTVVVPVNVGLDTPGRLVIGKTETPIDLPWVRCLPGGCFASVQLDDAALQQLQSAPPKVTVQWQSGGGQIVNLPISLRGFPQAFGNMSKSKG